MKQLAVYRIGARPPQRGETMNREVRQLIAARIEDAAREGDARILHTISGFAAQAQSLANNVLEAKEDDPDVDVDTIVENYERDHDYYAKTKRELLGFTTYAALGVGDSFVLEAEWSKRGATTYRKTDAPGLAYKNNMSGETIMLHDDTVVCATAW